LETDKQEIRRLDVVGCDASRAKEYYRTSFPTSSVKFRWLKGKRVAGLKNGTEKVQFLEFFAGASGYATPPILDGGIP
jgi:hypothetical protein